MSFLSSKGVKRPQESNGSSQKKKAVSEEPLRIGPVANLEEMDTEVLRLQHTKLKHRLDQKQKAKQDLIEQIYQLENRQTQDDAVLNVINRYWNQLNEDIGIVLQRSGVKAVESSSDDSEGKNESENSTSFLTQSSTWDKTELDEKLANRVKVSKQGVDNIIQSFDQMQQRNENVTKSIKGEIKTEEEEGEILSSVNINDIIKEESIRIDKENRSLASFNTHLEEKLRVMGSKYSAMNEKLSAQETKGFELKNQVENLQWDLNKLLSYNDKLVINIQDLIEKCRRLQQMYESDGHGSKREKKVEITDSEVSNLRKEIEELREQASNRLNELEKLHKIQRETLKELEKLRIDIRQLPESVIVDTVEYKCLQSKFSVIYNDTLQLRATLDETRNQLLSMRTNHLKHIEQMESEELLGQKKLRTEMIQVEDMIGVVRKEYGMLRLEFEQNLAAHEQTGPINQEMRHLITSLQNHNHQLKEDTHRYKKKYRDHCNENAKLKKQKEDIESKIRAQEKAYAALIVSLEEEKDDDDDSPSGSGTVEKESCDPSLQNVEGKESTTNEGPDGTRTEKPILGATLKKGIKKEVKPGTSKVSNLKVVESESIKDLKAQLKKAHTDQKEMKFLLDIYKGANKDPRNDNQILASVKKIQQESEEVKTAIAKLKENKIDEKGKLSDEQALKRIKSLEEGMHSLQRQIKSQKNEEDTLVNEMDVTDQAFEDMLIENERLIEQLREKDHANFKLLSDRAKACQCEKLSMEEKELLQEHHVTLTNQLKTKDYVAEKLEEKKKLLINSITKMEQEVSLSQQALEFHKRKTTENLQSAADLKLHLEKYISQMKDAQQTVSEKTSALEAEAYKTARLQEDIVLIKKKLQRLEKIEMTGNTDRVMMEEIKVYKEALTCSACRIKRKDAVLIKCFHVFCFDCLRIRYETRQRKCPKCNAAFGVNDFHRLYLA